MCYVDQFSCFMLCNQYPNIIFTISAVLLMMMVFRYFSHWDNICKPYNYSGCGANLNHFISEVKNLFVGTRIENHHANIIPINMINDDPHSIHHHNHYKVECLQLAYQSGHHHDPSL